MGCRLNFSNYKTREIMTSREKVKNLLEGKRLDRILIFERLRNDAVIEYYTEKKIDFKNAEDLVFETIKKAFDAVSAPIQIPQPEKEEQLADGRRKVQKRWTVWMEQGSTAFIRDYLREWQKRIESGYNWTEEDENSLRKSLDIHRYYQKKIDNSFLFWDVVGDPGLHNILWNTIGLEQFSYLMADSPGLIWAILEYNTAKSIMRVEHVPEEEEIKGVIIRTDIGMKEKTVVSPAFVRQVFLPNLTKIFSACKSRGWKVMFHSDGNLMEILDDLLEIGIDILQPIEITAGMDPKEIHRRYPDLIMARVIDGSQLLPYGKPEKIRDVVMQTIEDTEGKVMIGSTSGLHNEIPLKNAITMYETARNYRYFLT